MPVPSDSSSSILSPARLWAEQLATGMGLFLGLLIFMAVEHRSMFAKGAEVLGPNDLEAYGWASVVGIVLQILVHEVGTMLALRGLKIPIKLRFFGFGANATAALEQQPRNVYRDALVGFAGPMSGTLVSALLSVVYEITKYEDVSMQVGNPFFLGMACVGFFYSLITLIPILDLEGGWIAPAIAPQAWLFGLVGSVLALTSYFNLVLLGVVCFGFPRFVQILRARAPRTDAACTNRQRLFMAVGYFALVIGLAWYSSTVFDTLPSLVLEAKGD